MAEEKAKYEEIADCIMRELDEGKRKPGERIYSENELVSLSGEQADGKACGICPGGPGGSEKGQRKWDLYKRAGKTGGEKAQQNHADCCYDNLCRRVHFPQHAAGDGVQIVPRRLYAADLIYL